MTWDWKESWNSGPSTWGWRKQSRANMDPEKELKFISGDIHELRQLRQTARHFERTARRRTETYLRDTRHIRHRVISDIKKNPSNHQFELLQRINDIRHRLHKLLEPQRIRFLHKSEESDTASSVSELTDPSDSEPEITHPYSRSF